jgi:hydrogenase maturation protein HypF
MISRVCLLLRDRSGLGTVALSGGVFQNLFLLNGVTEVLEKDGFRVLVHARVPPNDGGISLGQATVAAARDRRARAQGSRHTVVGLTSASSSIRETGTS